MNPLFRSFLPLGTFMLLWGWLGLLLVGATDRLNVLMILVDDLRPALGCYGDPLAITPHIDRLASESRVFHRAYCQQAVCGPSRTSLLTGRLPDDTKVWHNRNRFRKAHPNLRTLPQLFRESGWHSVGLGKVFSGNEKELDPASWSEPEVLRKKGWKTSLLQDGDGKGQPMEDPDVSDDAYPDGKLARLGMEKLDELARRRTPFFLALGFFKPHLPFNAPRKYWDMHDRTRFRPLEQDHRAAGAPECAYPDHLELAGYLGMPADERLGASQSAALRHGYYACVSYVDAQIGKVLSRLKELGLKEQTAVILLGDHGYSLGEGDHWCKDTNFERDTRVPLMMRFPGLMRPGASTEALVELVDVLPTIVEMVKLEAPGDLAGQSLVPWLENSNRPGRDAVLSQFSRPFRAGNPEIMGYSLRTPRHRYTRWVRWQTGELLSEEWYDDTRLDSVTLSSGISVERHNLVGGSPDENPDLAQLRLRLDRMLQQRGLHSR